MEERSIQSRLDAVEMNATRLARWLKLAICGWLLTGFVILLSAWTWEAKTTSKDVVYPKNLVAFDF